MQDLWQELHNFFGWSMRTCPRNRALAQSLLQRKSPGRGQCVQHNLSTCGLFSRAAQSSLFTSSLCGQHGLHFHGIVANSLLLLDTGVIANHYRTRPRSKDSHAFAPASIVHHLSSRVDDHDSRPLSSTVLPSWRASSAESMTGSFACSGASAFLPSACTCTSLDA